MKVDQHADELAKSFPVFECAMDYMSDVTYLAVSAFPLLV